MATKDDEQPPVHILFFPFPAPGHLIPIADMATLFAARGASQFSWSVDAAAEHGVPRIAFLGTSMFARACTDTMLRKNPMMEASPDQDDPDAMLLLPGLPHPVELRRSQMPDPRKEPEVLAFFKVMYQEDRRSYGEVFNSFHELEPEYVQHYQDTLGRRVWLVGPVARPDKDARSRASNTNNALSPDADGCLRWLDGKPAGSVVYVSFGTLSNFSPDELRQVARGLDLSARYFLWVIGTGAITNAAPSSEWMPEGFTELLARGERGLVVRGWAPQVLILNHPALGGFVTHCGWNSVLEAVSAGVPMVTWPRYGDQFFNEKLVVEILKVAASVGAKDYASPVETHQLIDAEVIAESIGRVMDDGGDAIRSNAKELGVKARRALENGGSSYGDVGRLMEELMARRR
ncbi:scopoletin glucosyltransferase-like isoform X2 [Lolium rigidum]|uniref:scopoletin glucosyltransferase-like isoform X2 n=1 Tax=Lolium rigidum TaxID=89674 RepID=UPI001F5D3A94|nr:scopoletin glucosyltransferase-like isoform X2 [Lolium rigidum]